MNLCNYKSGINVMMKHKRQDTVYLLKEPGEW